MARGYNAFNDLHALMAYAHAGRDDQVRRIMAVLEQHSGSPDTNGHDTRAWVLPSRAPSWRRPD